MTPELIAAICTGIATLIAAVTTLIVAIKTKNKLEAEAISKDKKLDEIHVLVNSRLTEALQKIESLENHIDSKGVKKNGR